MSLDHNWRDGLAIIEEFYGEPISRELISLIGSTPGEQIDELLDRMEYVHPRGGWHQVGVPVTTKDEERVHVLFAEQSAPLPLRRITSLPHLIVFAEKMTVVDPFINLRLGRYPENHNSDKIAAVFMERQAAFNRLIRLPHKTDQEKTEIRAARAEVNRLDDSMRKLRRARSDDRVYERTEIAAACTDLLPVIPLIRSGIISFVPQPDIGTREYNDSALFDHPTASLAVPLEPWIDYAKWEGIENPSRGDAILAWESLLGDDDPWSQASAQIIGRVDLKAFQEVIALADFSQQSGLTPLFTSADGIRLAKFGHKELTGLAQPLILQIPLMELNLGQAIVLRNSEEIFQMFRNGLSSLMATEPSGSVDNFVHSLRETASEVLPEALAGFERVRARNRAISTLVPMGGRALFGAAVGAATHGVGSGAGRGFGGAVGRKMVKSSAARRDAADVAYQLTLNLIEMGRM